MEVLRSGDPGGLERLVRHEPRTARLLFGRLWDRDEDVRNRAAVGLGATAEVHPELACDLLRRALWALNDESATNGAAVLPMIGEMGRRNPGLTAAFVGPMVGLAWDRGLRPGILRALRRIVDVAPEVVRPQLERFSGMTDASDDELRLWIEICDAAGEEATE